MNKNTSLLQLEGKVSLQKALPFGLQHVLTMFVANITPAILIANACNIEQGLSVCLIQNAMIIAGIATLIQIYPLWQIGVRLPLVMGASFTFLSISIFIGTKYGMGTLMASSVIGGIFAGFLGLLAKYWMKFIRPVVSACVVTAIGFSLLKIGADSFAGGQGAADFGSAQNWIVGSITLVACIAFHVWAKGFLQSISILVGLVIGYIIAACMGMVDFSTVLNSGFVKLPTFMPFEPEINISAIISLLVIYLVGTTENIGTTNALTSTIANRNAAPKEIVGSLSCMGFSSALGGLFGCIPLTGYAQNVGLTNMTKVVNRFAIATGAIMMIIAGVFPIVGNLLTSIPQCVLGGCSIMMFGSILLVGFRMIAKCYDNYDHRTTVIISVSLCIGIGFTASPEMFNIFPQIIRSIFAENSIAVVFLVALVLDRLLPIKQHNKS